MDDVGGHYSKTMRGWMSNFNTNWDISLNKRYNKSDYLLWEYYILSCAAGFEEKTMYVWQFQLERI